MQRTMVQLGVASALLCLCAGCHSHESSSNWYPLGRGVGGASTSPWIESRLWGSPSGVFCLETYNGDLYAGGNFTTAGGREAIGIAKWDPWEPLGGGIASSDATRPAAVYAMKDYNSSLIVGGQFNRAGGRPAENVAQWAPNPAPWLFDVAGVWRELPGLNGAVHALATFRFGGEDWLVAGGAFNDHGHVARWREGEELWQQVGNGVGDAVQAVVAAPVALSRAAESRETLFAAGGRLVRGSSVAYLDTDDTWQPLGDITGVIALAIYQGQLYAAGNENSTGTRRGFVKRWAARDTPDSGTWQTVGLLEGTSVAQVEALTVYNNTLVVGGFFSRSGFYLFPAETRSIARWDGTVWKPFEGGISSLGVRALTTFAGDQLIVGGVFEQAGSEAANNIAGWRDSAP